MNPADILVPGQRRPSKCYLVNKLREAVYNWRQQGYPGVTETTKRLLQFWFNEDHIIEEDGNELFEFWFCQREAIETLIYVFEVLKKRKFIELAQEFGSGPIGMYNPEYDKYPLYAFKMATGSGKTFVMVMAIVWSYFNRIKENIEDYPSKFLLIAPNVIVYDRLKRDFEEGKIFKKFPFIPDEWKDEFNLKITLREDPINVIPENVLFLTNIQQLEERKKKSEEVDELFGLKEVETKELKEANRIREFLTSCPNIMILKDEAHHIYHVEKAWKKILINLHKKLEENYGKGIAMELDFSATPKTETGAYFPWIIVDFPLAEAIEMNIVKRPIKGILKRARETASTKAHEKYRAWIDAGIRRWREYKKSLEKLGKKPILFVMCENTKAADDVFTYINSIPDLKGKVLLIHTNLQGDIVKKDLEEARKVARKIDSPENEYECIVSVLMLNEGWDVRNVTVIVGLRSYTSKRKVLPEQVIGRGLRKMFPEEPAQNFVNMLEVIGPPGLTSILEELEKQEKIKLDTFDVSKPVNVTTIFVDEKKEKYNFSIPIISPRIVKKELNINKINVLTFPKGNFELGKKVFQTTYIGEDMLDKVIVVKRKWNLPVPQNSNSVIAYYTQKILKELRIPETTNFPILYPLLKKYVQRRLFKKEVKLEDPRVLYVLSEPMTEEFIFKLFVEKLRNLTFKIEEPKLIDTINVKNTKPFVWSKQVYPADKTVFNYIPCDNEFEIRFAKFLDNCKDVKSFIKVVPKMGFFIEYLSTDGYVRFYYPDFIVVTRNNEFYLVETKGLVDIEVANKEKRAKQWCKDVSKITKQRWNYVRINQKLFDEYIYSSFEELVKSVKINAER